MKKRVKLTLSLSVLLSIAVCARGAGPRKQNAISSVPSYASIAAIDTFVLHTESFNDGTLSPYTTVDFTAQLGTFFHVANATELNGGTFGNLDPLAGTKSMWCGKAPSAAVPFCGWAQLPGYGNDWNQILQSSALGGDSVVVTYKIFWDSESGYDQTLVEWTHNSGATWTVFPVTDTLSSRPGLYDGTALTPYMTESFGDRITGGTGTVMVRFRFESNGLGSDEDGLWTTDGALTLDDINIVTRTGNTLVANNTQTFESATVGSNTAGIWTGVTGAAFGNYAALYPGVALLQEDPCLFVPLFVVGFFDIPATTNYACHTPDPRPLVGAIPYGTAGGIYMNNAVVSPTFSNAGYGNGFLLSFNVYKDLPLDNLQFFTWRVRSWVGGCPGSWQNRDLVYYGSHRYWGSAFGAPGDPWWQPFVESIGDVVNASATGFQVAIGVVDMCGAWCGIYGSGSCHSHAPLIDDVRVMRIGVSGPQWRVRYVDLFQDTFAEDGTLAGTARADEANDILPRFNPAILPGDSVVLWCKPVGTAGAGSGPNAYVYLAVWPQGQAGKSGAALGSSTVRTSPQPTAYGTRWPFVGTTVANSITWACFRMDTVFTSSGVAVAGRFCVDLNDNLFTPGDTICYFFGADVDNTAGNGNEGYFTRNLRGQGGSVVHPTIASVAVSPMEFTILPAGGYNNGGDILYVDGADDRGSAQAFWDLAFEMNGISPLVDRYDILDPTVNANNSLASRVSNNVAQIVNVYQKILWDTGNLTGGLIGDGTGSPQKANDWALLDTLLHTGTLGVGPGLYLSGDDIAQEWVTLSGAGAIHARSTYMTFNVLNRSHILHGESVSPLMMATGASFIHAGVPDELVVYGGCPIVNDFDVLDPTGTSTTQFPYPVSGDGAVISKQTTNVNSKTATVVLSGFSYTYIRESEAQFPPARVEFLRDLLIKMGNVVPLPTGEDPDDAPQYANALYNNYPNPFNPTTTIKYGIKERGHVSLKVYNAAGQLVRTLVDEVQAPAALTPVTWDGSNNAGQTVSSGVYFYKLVTKNFSQTKKAVFLK